MKIQINTPCHENWDAMTPNERGAFCGSCCKNVIDFSKKTVTEIKDFFTQTPETEKVCGRFREEQLDEMTFDHFFKEFRSWQFLHKAAVILFFVFGFSLFGCAQNILKEPTHIKMGMVAYVPKDTIKPKQDSIKKPMIKGKVKCVPEKVNIPEDKRLMGEVMVQPDQIGRAHV